MPSAWGPKVVSIVPLALRRATAKSLLNLPTAIVLPSFCIATATGANGRACDVSLPAVPKDVSSAPALISSRFSNGSKAAAVAMQRRVVRVDLGDMVGLLGGLREKASVTIRYPGGRVIPPDHPVQGIRRRRSQRDVGTDMQWLTRTPASDLPSCPEQGRCAGRCASRGTAK